MSADAALRPPVDRPGAAGVSAAGSGGSGGLMPYLVGMSVLGAMVVVASVPSLVMSPPELWKLLAVLGLCALADLPLVERRVGHNVECFTFAEAFVLVSLVLVPAPPLVVVFALAVAGFGAASRVAPLKNAFNALSGAIGVGLAVLTLTAVSRLVTGSSPVAELPGLVAGTFVFHLWNSAAVSLALAKAQGVPFRSIYAQGAVMRSLVCIGNIAVGLSIVLVGTWNPRALALLPPVLAVLYFLYRGYLSANEERDVWQQLERATRELNLLEQGEIAGAALRRAKQLFRTDRVELLLDAGGRPQMYTLDAEGRPQVEDASPDQLFTRSARLVQVGAAGGEDAVMTFLVAPLEGPKGRVGTLRLIFDGPVKFSSRERQVLSTFAHSVGTTLLNAALYDDVRAEAARQAHQASHDHLTGLANRSLLRTSARGAVTGGVGTTALLLLDLDHFKEINDTLGHAAGDLLLMQIGERLNSLWDERTTVARLGGDEFALLLTGLASPEEAEPVADRVLSTLSDPVEFEGLRLSVEASLGLACHPQDADTADELFRRADVAMYQAKSARGQWLRYNADRDDSSVHRQALVAELRAAIEQDQLLVHYQPQVDLETGLVVGGEALCRWQHPSRGLLGPGEFVSVVEQSGLVRPFTMCVLDQAARQCVLWQEEGRPISVAVNLSARSLLDRQLPDDVAAVLARHGLPADRLVLEITETTATSELEVVEDVLSRLRQLGVEISVDDFGTGFSSLAFLQRTAVHELKVDRTFVSGMLTSENDLALVRATVQLARALGARSVAEGVEDGAQAAALREMGCDVAQGYWLSRPIPAVTMRGLLGLRVTAEPASAAHPPPRAGAKLRVLRPAASDR
jgi:diguanylate cyclase